MHVTAHHERASDDRRERQLLDRIADRDREAFDALFRAYHPRLFRFVFRITASYRATEEVVNDILLIVWQSAHTFRGDSRVSTWIFGIAYRQSLRHLRKRKITTIPIPDDKTVHTGAATLIEREDCVRSGSSKLPPTQPPTGMLASRMGLTYAETAVATGSPVNTIKTRMFHARRKLREYLAEIAG